MKVLFKILISCLFTFVVLLGTAVVFLQTDYGKNRLQKLVLNASESKGVSIRFDEIKGFLPFQWTFTDVVISVDSTKITAKNVSFRLSLFQLIKKTLAFKSFYASDVRTFGLAHKTSLSKEPSNIQLPFSLHVRSFIIKDFYVEQTNVPINLMGKFKLQKDGSYLFAQTRIERDGYTGSFIEANLRAERNRLVQFGTKGDIKQLDFLAFVKDISFDSEMQFQILAKGPYESFKNLIYQNADYPARDISGSLFLAFKDTSSLEKPPWKLKSDFTIDKSKALILSPLIVTTPVTTLRGSVSIEKKEGLTRCDLNLQPDNLVIYNQNVTNFNIAINSSGLTEQIEGNASFKLITEKTPFEGGFQFNYLKDGPFFLDDLVITSDGIDFKAAVAFEGLKQMNGQVVVTLEDLSLIEDAFPLGVTEGKAVVDVALTTANSRQLVSTYIDYSHLQYKELYSNEGRLQIFVEDLFYERNTSIEAEFKDAQIYGAYFSSISLKTAFEGENWPFTINVDGQNMQSNITGFWDYRNNSFDMNVQDINGASYQKPFLLKEPFSIKIEPESLEVTPVDIEMPNSSFLASLQIDKSNASIEISSQNFPIEFLSMNPLRLDIAGAVDSKVSLQKSNDKLNGSFSLNFSDVNILALGDKTPFTTNGHIKGEVHNNTLNLVLDSSVKEDKILELDAEIPITLNFYPFSLILKPYANTSGKLYYNGEIQEILDFIDLRFNYVQGQVLCDLTWEGTTDSPDMEGSIYIKDGIYENYVTGTYLENIQAILQGKKNTLELTEFTATDSKQGTVKAKGEIEVAYLDKFPFNFQASINDFIFVRRKNILGSATGNITIEGNFDSAITRGKAFITYGEFDIPEKIAAKVPNIAVTYKNQPKKRTVFVPKKKFPLYLDVELETDGNFFVRGRGLSSEWKGDIKLDGLYYDLQAEGRLDLIKGEFNFSGHYFDLTSGELIFTGDKGEFPFLNITAQTNIQGINIIAKWTGQINEPNLQFTSLPPLPMSSILSYLLFGSDISEITALQAVSLAATAASLSGGGPDILEITRRRLGFDRLAIVSAPTSEGAEDFAVQVGKYVAKGVLVTFSQGIEQGSSNVSVEVDLSHGFLFEAQTIQQQEQGRFSLKWNRNF